MDRFRTLIAGLRDLADPQTRLAVAPVRGDSEHDDVAHVAGFGLAQPSPLWSGAGQVV